MEALQNFSLMLQGACVWLRVEMGSACSPNDQIRLSVTKEGSGTIHVINPFPLIYVYVQAIVAS